ncbi:hypothetical protein B0T26DRAFT_706604 [Lasiosphaeria miniovina]|uniref:Heterokaryon incompatibility domain-containing protein n=1 Tax=Lasiosphaeria miniovina TaxID=1954250 RepID=A0AA40E3B8_9PEZI|nr:uncharacterized protein B0T26DRAFT_706604 [Lasiosphaeria miniovina]KAK0723502.1 hypothetical protein B0T26DRAFT_706604 [Lasiosphaeria miniovina]
MVRAMVVHKAPELITDRIDSLCIIQNDKYDWISEAERMGDIYENSHVTLMATDSQDGRGGLFPQRATSPPLSRHGGRR